MLKDPIIPAIEKAIRDASSIIVTTHTNPDGDAIGSASALALYLRKTGKKADVIVPNNYPDFLKWMPGIEQVLIWDKQKKTCKDLIQQADLIFCLDYNALSRIESMQDTIKKNTATRILIDHHITPSDEFDLLFHDITSSSTAELVYRFISQMDNLDLIDTDIAVNLFVGIMTDTGSFSFACSRPEVFHIAGDLISRGVDPEQAHRQVYDTYSENRMRLLGHGLSERMKVMPEFSTAYIYLSKDDLIRFHHRIGDTEGLVNYPLSIKGINLSVLFTEKHDRIRMSLRSKGKFSVNDFVRAHYEGGGHRNAAGGNSYESLNDTLVKFEALLPAYSDALKKS